MRWLLSASAALIIVIALLVMSAAAAGGQAQRNPAARAGDGETFLAHHTPARPPVTGRTPAFVQPSAVQGPDDRQQVLDTTAFPFSAVAYLELFGEVGEAFAHCTGTFVGPDTLLTAAHCLYDPVDGWTWYINVWPGSDTPYHPYGSDYAENWWVPDAWIDSGGDPLYDWGIVKMPDTYYGNTVGWLPIVAMTEETLQRPDFTPAISGYPGDKPDGTQWFASEEAFLSVNDYTLDYLVDTAGGQSGSAIFSANLFEDFGGAIVGIHAYGYSTYNSGTRIEQTLLDDILTGCEEMGCSIEAYIEDGPTITPEPVGWLQGDADCSGGVDIGDIAVLLQIAIGQPAPFGCATDQNDVDCANGTNPIDALAVAIYLSEADPLPVNGSCTPIGEPVG